MLRGHHAAAMLVEYGGQLSLTGKLMRNTAPREAMRRCMRAAGITHRFTLHGFRHTFNDLIRQTNSTIVAQALVGHSSDDMTERYSHVSALEKHAAVAQLHARIAGNGGNSGSTAS